MTTTTMKKEKGRIRRKGMGGFLNPPTHPEHAMSVETDLIRRPENRGSMSLTAAVDAEWLDDATRASAKRILEAWQSPPIESPEVQEWILKVLGYFKGCWKGDGPAPECWNVQNLRMGKGAGPGADLTHHAGVHLIRKYYSDFLPTQEHFDKAYWGKKPD